MILWTIVPVEEVLGESQDLQVAELSVGSRCLLLERHPDGQHRILRLLSTDPADYLDPRLMPGALWPEA